MLEKGHRRNKYVLLCEAERYRVPTPVWLMKVSKERDNNKEMMIVKNNVGLTNKWRPDESGGIEDTHVPFIGLAFPSVAQPRHG